MSFGLALPVLCGRLDLAANLQKSAPLTYAPREMAAPVANAGCKAFSGWVVWGLVALGARNRTGSARAADAKQCN